MNVLVNTPAYIERFGALLMTCLLMADSDYDMGVFTRMSYLLSFTYIQDKMNCAIGYIDYYSEFS